MSREHSALHKVSIQSIDLGLSHIPGFRCFQFCFAVCSFSNLSVRRSQTQSDTFRQQLGLMALWWDAWPWRRADIRKGSRVGAGTCSELPLIYECIKWFMVKGPLHFLGCKAVNQNNTIVNPHTQTHTYIHTQRCGSSRTEPVSRWFETRHDVTSISKQNHGLCSSWECTVHARLKTWFKYFSWFKRTLMLPYVCFCFCFF